jgi:threonine/homoserine/homoserine lactone efflux protein
MLLLAAGFLLSLFGSIPPGLISLSVAHAAMGRGWRAAMWMAGGAAGAEFFQAWAAVALTGWFLEHPGAERWFQWAAWPVFFALAAYLWFLAPLPAPPGALAPVSAARLAGRGVLISAFNLLAIPYWFAYCGWLQVSGWWPRQTLESTLTFSAGVALGTLAALGLYAGAAHFLVRHSDLAARRANRLIALIFALLGAKVLWDLGQAT